MRKLIACVVLWWALPASAAPLPVEAFGRIPQIENVALAPSGNRIAWQENRGDRQAIVVHDLGAGKVLRGMALEPSTKLRDLTWFDDATLLFEVSVTHRIRSTHFRKEWFRLLSMDVATGKSRVLLMKDDERQWVAGATVLATRSANPNAIVMSSWDYLHTLQRESTGTRLSEGRQHSGWIYSMFEVDTRTGRGSVLAHGDQFTDGWAVDAAGRPIARGDWKPEQREYTVHARDGAAWRKIHTQQRADQLSLIGPSAEGDAVLALGANGHKTRKVWKIPLDGSGASVLIEDAERDVLGVRTDPLTRLPIAVYFGGSEGATRWLDKKAQARQEAVARSFPGRDTWIVGHSQDYKRAIAQVESPSHPPIYYLIDFGTNRADIIGDAYPALAEAKLGEVRAISYKARDGAPIPAYVTLPPGIEPKNLPLVVLPHGGPESRDHLEFDWWTQFLASRGYVVLQPQFRGSTGFGEAHRLAGRQQWGGVMQDDISDGVAHLVAEHIAEPKRVCIVGASYGGYAALAGAAFTPDLYACAASVNGISDLPAMISHEEETYGDDSDAAAYWRDLIGSKGIAEKSPARAAASVKIPVLLMHGADDTVVPASQSQKMATALQAVKRPVQMIKLPGEDHWLSRSETRIRVLKELEAFLAANLAAPAASASR